MAKSQYVSFGKKVTDHLGPINAPMFIGTGALVKEQLELLVQHGYGLNEPTTVQANADSAAPPNLYACAKYIGNEEAAQLLASMGSDTTVYEPWKAKKPKPVVLPGIL